MHYHLWIDRPEGVARLLGRDRGITMESETTGTDRPMRACSRDYTMLFTHHRYRWADPYEIGSLSAAVLGRARPLVECILLDREGRIVAQTYGVNERDASRKAVAAAAEDGEAGEAKVEEV